MQHASARHIAIVRFLCGLGAQVSVSDLYRNAIAFSGHRFLLTVFGTRRNGARAPLYYCRCREIAVRDNFSDGFLGLGPNGSDRQLEFAPSPNSTEQASGPAAADSFQGRSIRSGRDRPRRVR